MRTTCERCNSSKTRSSTPLLDQRLVELREQHPVLQLDVRLQVLGELAAHGDPTPVIMVSGQGQAELAVRALRAGARGYIMKAEAPEKVIEAIRRVLDGALYLSEAIGGRLLDTFLNGRASTGGGSAVDQLSDRELEIFHALGEGRSTREIALTLFLSVKTVETHRSHIKEKLKVQTAPELIRAAVEWVNSQSNK